MQPLTTPVESLLDGQITWDLNMPEVQELDRFINSPSSPKFVSVPPSAFETNSSTVDVQTVVEEVDEIKEIDDGLLSELDNIGDFSIGQLGSGTSEFEKHVDCVKEESLFSTHHAETSTTRVLEVHSVEVNKIDHLLHSEESMEDYNVYEQDLEDLSELLNYQISRAENIEVSRKEFDKNDHDFLNQETSGEETLSKENEVLPAHPLVNQNREDIISGMAEMEVRSTENVGGVARKAELASVETEVMEGVAEVSCQGQVDKDTTSGMLELEGSSIEDIDQAFKQISSKESEKHFVLDPPQPELQNHEDTVSTVPESEVLSTDDIDAVPKDPESASVDTEIVVGVADIYCQGQVDADTTSGMTELEARTVEDSSEVIEEPLVLEPVDTDAASELEASKTEDIDLASKQIISKEIEKHVVLEPPHADLEDTEVLLAEDVHAVPEHTELTSVEKEIIMEDNDLSSEGQVNADYTSEITEIEASTVDLAFEQDISEAIEKPVDLEPVDTCITSGMPEIDASSVEDVNLAFKHISSEEIKNYDVLEPVDTDTTSGMPEIEASSIEAINLAFKHIDSEETKNCDVLEPLRPELVIGETITEDAAPHRDTIVPVSTNETSVLEVGPSKDVILDNKKMDDSTTGIDGLHDSVDITENSEDAVLHRDRSVMVSTNVTPIVKVGPNKDAMLDGEKLTDNITGTDRLYDRTLHVVELGETQGATSELHAVEAVSSEGTTLPPNQVFNGETAGQMKFELDDESVKVKAGDKIGPSEEKSSIKESSALKAEKPNHEDEAPKDLHSPSSVKGKGVEGKGKLSRSSSSSSSSSSDSSSSDSDRE